LPPPFISVSKNMIRDDAVEFQWRLGQSGRVQIAIFNSAGEFVKTLFDQDASAFAVYSIPWDATNAKGEHVASNVYVVRFNAPGFSRTYKLGVQQ